MVLESVMMKKTQEILAQAEKRNECCNKLFIRKKTAMFFLYASGPVWGSGTNSKVKIY